MAIPRWKTVIPDADRARPTPSPTPRKPATTSPTPEPPPAFRAPVAVPRPAPAPRVAPVTPAPSAADRGWSVNQQLLNPSVLVNGLTPEQAQESPRVQLVSPSLAAERVAPAERVTIPAPEWDKPATNPIEQFVRNFQVVATDVANSSSPLLQPIVDSVVQPEPPRPSTDEYVAPGQRASQLSNTFELTQEDYDALTDQQKAVVQFNTGLVEAAHADDVAGNTDATEDYLALLGITPTSKNELDEFLQLDRLVSEKILEKLSDSRAIQSAADSMRWARGDVSAVDEARRISNAQSIGELTAPHVAQQLSALGTPSTTATTPAPGFGSTPNDLAIQQVYYNMIDSRYNLTPDDVALGIAQMNATDGTNISIGQVYDFLSSQIQSAEFNLQGKKAEKLPAPTFDPASGEAITPLDIAEIRRRYGL